MKEKARKAAQKKAKKEAKKKAPSPYSSPNQSGSRSATPSASDVPLSYLSTFAASTTPTPPPSASAPVPAALLAEIEDDDKPGWQKSVDAAWAQGQKNICIRWVREKRAKLARAEAALAESTLAGRAAVDEEVEVSSFLVHQTRSVRRS
jgi:hypothetical protein